MHDLVMRIIALPKFGAHRRPLIPAWLRRCRHARLSACVLVVALCAPTLAGCARDYAVRSAAEPRTKTTSQHAAVRAKAVARVAPIIPKLDPTLLEPASAVDCAFPGTMSNPASVEETRTKLDYEAQCYRQQEAIVRARLQRLQDAAQKMIRAVRQRNLVMSSR